MIVIIRVNKLFFKGFMMVCLKWISKMFSEIKKNQIQMIQIVEEKNCIKVGGFQVFSL